MRTLEEYKAARKRANQKYRKTEKGKAANKRAFKKYYDRLLRAVPPETRRDG